MDNSKFKIAVIGGGISGLAAAYHLQELKQNQNLPIEITLLEAKNRFGGIIETDLSHGCCAEGGPDSFISEKPWAIDLCRRLGIESEIISTQSQNRRSFIYFNQKLHPVPQGFYLCAPSDWMGLIKTDLLSFRGKLRMAFEWFKAKRISQDDESVAHFIRRRLGDEAFERIGQPMISGIYTADPEKLSMQATMPKLVAMERDEGSLIRALMKSKQDEKTATGIASGPRYSLFLSLKGGIETLTKTLIRRLTGVNLMRCARVLSLTRELDWCIKLEDGEVEHADFICLAVPAPQAAQMLMNCARPVSEALKAIPYESVAAVNLLFERDKIQNPLNGFGFVVPASENRKLVGCTFSSVKYEGRVNQPNHVLLRAFVGGALQRDLLDQEDAAILQMIRSELTDILEIQGNPIWSSVSRLAGAMPQYHLNHLERVSQIDELLSDYPGLYLTGNAYHGVGIPDCIHHAEETVEQMVKNIKVAEQVKQI